MNILLPEGTKVCKDFDCNEVVLVFPDEDSAIMAFELLVELGIQSEGHDSQLEDFNANEEE